MKKYIPSNGTEGEGFFECFCYHCINCDPDPCGEKQCDIMLRALCYDIDEPEYPTEWVYVENKPTCTAYVPWDWDNDGNPDKPENPKSPPVYDPNQISFPFIEALEVEEIKEEVNVQPQL